MLVDEKNCKSEINALSYQDLQPLIALIPEIEKTSKFGKWYGGTKNKDEVIISPYSEPASIVSKFVEIVYSIPIIIEFNWPAWDEGQKILRNKQFDFNTIDLVTKCKLITAIVRSDRFCSGALVSEFEKGLILKILKSIKKEVIAKERVNKC